MDRDLTRLLRSAWMPAGAPHSVHGCDTHVLSLPSGRALVLAVDTLVCGVHFPADTPPGRIGHKALAVNLSDLAAMGAAPLSASVSLNVPGCDTNWVERFAAGMEVLASRFTVRGGGMRVASGALAVTVEVTGLAPEEGCLLRSAARGGDGIYVTGTLGDAGAALALRAGEIQALARHTDFLEARLSMPEPRLATGARLCGIANAAIDVSDGLCQDLGHILSASGVGASIEIDRLPLSSSLSACCEPERARHLAASAGDDFELCFTVPPAREPALHGIASACGCPFTRIGTIESRPGLRVLAADGSSVRVQPGYRHFAAGAPDAGSA